MYKRQQQQERGVIFFADVLDPATGLREGEYLPRAYRISSSEQQLRPELPSEDDVLVCGSREELDAAMLCMWELEALRDPRSLAARAPLLQGTLIDVPVRVLHEQPHLWQHTQQTVGARKQLPTLQAVVQQPSQMQQAVSGSHRRGVYYSSRRRSKPTWRSCWTTSSSLSARTAAWSLRSWTSASRCSSSSSIFNTCRSSCSCKRSCRYGSAARWCILLLAPMLLLLT